MAWWFPVLVTLQLAAPAPTEPGAAMARARADLHKKKKDLADTRTALSGVAQWENALVRAEGFQLLADVELADKKPDVSVKRLKEALNALDDGNAPPKVRAKLLGKMKDFSVRQKHKGLEATLAALKEADTVLAAAEKWPLFPQAPLNPSTETMETTVKTYATEGLKLRATRARAMLAVALGVEGRKAALERAKEALAGAPSVDTAEGKKLAITLRRASARARVALARTEVKAAAPLERVVKDALEADALEAPFTGLAPPYHRSPTTAALCDALEAVPGTTCRSLEASAGLEPSFRDFSRRAPTEALSDADANRTQAEFGFLLNQCLKDGAKADPVLLGVNFELTWVVQPNGRADEVQLDPRRFRDHAAAACLRNALGRFRYPPYKSAERRVVAVGIAVTGY